MESLEGRAIVSRQTSATVFPARPPFSAERRLSRVVAKWVGELGSSGVRVASRAACDCSAAFTDAPPGRWSWCWKGGGSVGRRDASVLILDVGCFVLMVLWVWEVVGGFGVGMVNVFVLEFVWDILKW